jgi:tRNA-specific 2-thiouridylase
MESKDIHVFVGVSGGVDSSVALALLKEKGYKVTGVFLKVWSPDFLPCTWRDERRSAMRVCAALGVPFITLDCEQEYKEHIVDYMLHEYKEGRTPNPDVFCNKYIKFGVFLKKAQELGATHIATGHYAQLKTHTENGNILYDLFEAVDTEKDQSYFLSELTQYELSRSMFPIGHLPKSEVRAIASRYNLPTATKKDSQGLCFIGKIDMKDFLSYYIDTTPGQVLSTSGEVIGTHNGAVLYTIGERHGFTITKKTSHDNKLFVLSKDIARNTITVGEKTESIRSSGVYTVSSLSWTHKEPDCSRTYAVRFRYRQEKIPCHIEKEGDVYHIHTDTDVFAIAPGQIAVLYDNHVVVGAGVLK